jgi:hypothetical protein
MAFGKPDAGKPPVRFDEGRSVTVFGLVPLNPFAPPTLLNRVMLAKISGSKSAFGFTV